MIKPHTWNVKVERHATKEIYRFADPYASDPVLGEKCTPDSNRYLYLNAENPNNVFFCDENGDKVEKYNTGVTMSYPYIDQGEKICEWNLLKTPNADCLAIFKNGNFFFHNNDILSSNLGVKPTDEENDSFRLGANADCRMKISLPDAKDYELRINRNLYCTRGDTITFGLEFGSDIHHFRYGFSEYPCEMLWYNINQIHMSDNQTPISGNYYVGISDLRGHTVKSLVIKGYDEFGNNVGTIFRDFIYDGGDDDDWETLQGDGLFTDNLIAASNSAICKVKVQRHKTIKDYYRIVDPFTNDDWYAYGWPKNTEHHHYLYINATDHNKVFIEYSSIGICHRISFTNGYLYDYGYVAIASDGYFNKFGKISNPNYGTMQDDGRIIFPTIIYSGFSNKSRGRGGRSITNKPSILQLPESWSKIDDIDIDINTDKPAEYYNMQGIRVSNAESTPGIYIRRHNGKVTKVYVK